MLHVIECDSQNDKCIHAATPLYCDFIRSLLSAHVRQTFDFVTVYWFGLVCAHSKLQCTGSGTCLLRCPVNLQYRLPTCVY